MCNNGIQIAHAASPHKNRTHFELCRSNRRCQIKPSKRTVSLGSFCLLSSACVRGSTSTSLPFYRMARSLSNLLCKGISFSGSAARSAIILAPGSFYINEMRYSTTVPNEPDTHDDFKPTNKLENSGLTLKDLVEQDVKDNPVMLYMKGVPELPQCGFSSLAVRVLKQYNVPLSARNILEDPEVKSAVKAFREFIGGSDIILNMHQTGELKEKLQDISANQGKSE